MTRSARRVMIAICAVSVASPARAHAEPSTEARDVPGVPGVPGVHDAPDAHDDGSVVIGGGAEDHDRTVVSAAVVATARAAGWSLPREPVTKQDADQLLDCGDPDKP